MFCAPTNVTNMYNRQSSACCWLEGCHGNARFYPFMYKIRCKSENQMFGALNIVTIRNKKYILTRPQFLCRKSRS